MTGTTPHKHRRGVGYAAVAYFIWGLLPAYWKLLQSLGPLEILAHRILWSFLFLMGLILVRREWGVVRGAVSRPRTVGLYAAAAVLLGMNWGVYIWAVNAAHIVETSLGYYINPLVSVVLAVVFLHERLRRIQWLAVGIAAIGVAQLTWAYGRPPWIALILASSFGLYGLVKKLAPLGALPGLVLETATLLPLAAVYLGWAERTGTGAFGHAGGRVTALLVLAGLMTSLPLLLFARAAREVSLSTLGLLQYIAPTCALVLGVAVYGESFPPGRAFGFALIWGALALYWAEGAWTARLRRAEDPGARS